MKMIYKGLEKPGVLSSNKIYDCEYTPKIYDPQSFNVYIGLIVRCDDDKYRKFETSDFISVDEMRDQKISEILDPEKNP
jgi:hypothetical protein